MSEKLKLKMGKKPKKMVLNRNEERTILAVFEELEKMGYSKMNTFLGSVTIREMEALYNKICRNYDSGSINDELEA